MRALPPRAALWSGALMCLFLSVSTAAFAQSVQGSAIATKPVITLAPSAIPDAYRLMPKAGEVSFANAPANFHAFASARVGEIADEEQLTLKFSGSTQLTKIESTKDFYVDPASGCQVGNRYAEGDSCTLLVRFTPQGAGRQLGKVTISHTASPQPLAIGLGGNGYAPVISFTPAVITTVPGTYPSNKGLLSGALNMTVDGGDVVYIADIGNTFIRKIDSSGSITNISPVFNTAASVAVDSFGLIWALNVSGSLYYLTIYYPDSVETAYGYSPAPGTCTPSAPCAFSTAGMDDPANINIDSNNNLFMEEETQGALEMPVGGFVGGTVALNLWYLSDVFAYSSDPPATFAVDPNDNLYTYYTFTGANPTVCYILQEALYGAEAGTPVYTRVAGASNCGFSGDGGQARDAEIGTSVGQMAFDIAGNMYFSDTGNQRVRRIDASTGIINTIAGDGTAGYTGDGYEATYAELSSPTGVAVDSQGQVYIISSAATGQVIRKLGPNGALQLGSQVKNTSGIAHLVTVANTGNAAMVLTGVNITGTDASEFKIDPNTTSCNLTANAELANGQSCKVGIIFTPATTGIRTANLVFLDNTVTNMNTVQLSGTGVLPLPTFTITAPASSATETSGTAFTFSVSVTSASGPQPTGTVKMLLNGTAISGSPATLNGSGVASLSVTSTTTGTNTLSATYNGDSNYSADGPITRTVTVNAEAVTKESKVTVASSANPATACSTISFSVTVTGTGSETPTGTVKLMNGTALLGEASLSSGSARLPSVRLTAGSNELTATYSGDVTHEAASSTPFKQMVVAGAGCEPVARLPRPIMNPGGLRAW